MATTDIVAVVVGVFEKMGNGERVGDGVNVAAGVGDMVAVRVYDGVVVWVEV